MAKPITTFTRANVAQLQEHVKNNLAPIASKYGIKIEMGRGTFSENAFTLKIEGAVVAADGTAVTKEAEAFRRYARDFGLEPTDLGLTFPFRGGTAKIVGCNPRAPRMPIIVEDESGKRWKTSPESVRLPRIRANEQQHT